jgi:hypothetical protein
MRKVRTPQSEVPREERGVRGRKPSDTDSVTENIPSRLSFGRDAIRVKRRGKSSPPCQQWQGQDKPHLEQDHVGEEKLLASLFAVGTWSWQRHNSRVGRLSPPATADPDKWLPPPFGEDRIRLTDLHCFFRHYPGYSPRRAARKNSFSRWRPVGLDSKGKPLDGC